MRRRLEGEGKLTCSKFEFIGSKLFVLLVLLTPLEADEDALDSRETVSLNAESLSGLSVRDSRDVPPESEPLPLPLSDEVEIDAFVTPEIVELERECVRPCRLSPLIGVAFVLSVAAPTTTVVRPALPLVVPFALTVLQLRCSSWLSSPRIASSSASCVSSRFAIENRYELVRSDEVSLCGRSRGRGAVFGISKPCNEKMEIN